MPFTPSHALVALPFIRTPLVPAAIAIGAMTPDLPMFVRGVGMSYGFTHTFSNVLLTAAIAFVLFMIWRVVLRPASVLLAPRTIASRLPADWEDRGLSAAGRAIGRGLPRAYPVLLALSLVIGVLSHILWDLFTHEGRWGVALLPALDARWGPLTGYKWLQHGSSVVGLVVIGIWAMLRLRAATVRDLAGPGLPLWVRITWVASLPVILTGAWIAGMIAYGPFTGDFTVQHLAYRVLPTATGTWGFLTLLLCVVVTWPRAPISEPHQLG